jgi:hypothetical protein
LPGHCQWRVRNIEVSVNRLSYSAFSASWQSLVWVGGVIGTPGLEEVQYVCQPPTPTSTALWCKGPIAAVSAVPGQLRASFVMDANR